MNIFLEMLIEAMKQTTLLQQIKVELEATNKKLDTIIGLITPPEVVAARGVYGTPEHN